MYYGHNKRSTFTATQPAHFIFAGGQGCQMVYFHTKNLVKTWRTLEWKMLVYFMAIWNILLQFDIFYVHLVYFVPT
jgi:hypothetical protein